MDAAEIIWRMANTEGFPVNRDDLADFLVSRMTCQYVFQYENVVFTVNKDTHVSHIYSDDSGHNLLSSARKFMSEVWGVTGAEMLFAPVMDYRVKRFIERFGWKSLCVLDSGHEMYYAVRSVQ